MARPREFNVDHALDQALQVFWSKGYESASLRDLIGAMGISKSSFYDTFGSKHELFLTVIDRYNSTVASCGMEAMIQNAPSPKAGIRNLFHGIIETMVQTGEKRGCFLANCAVEVACHDDQAAGRIATGLAKTEETFYCAIRRAQKLGEIGPDKEPRPLARYLTGTLNGLLVMGKAKPDRRTLQDVVRVALTVLD
jgi:TetR/AcrR family transcriptional repressor of nem operon